MFRTNPGTWKLGVFWERTYAEIAQNRTKSHKIAESRLVQRPELPEQRGCVPGSEYYFKECTRTRRVIDTHLEPSFLDTYGTR